MEVGTTNEMNDRLDAVYGAKYSRYPKSYIDSITSGKARSATIKLVPRE